MAVQLDAPGSPESQEASNRTAWKQRAALWQGFQRHCELAFVLPPLAKASREARSNGAETITRAMNQRSTR